MGFDKRRKSLEIGDFGTMADMIASFLALNCRYDRAV
jgi:hypothetical protein